jgi:hypothetical protein
MTTVRTPSSKMSEDADVVAWAIKNLGPVAVRGGTEPAGS